MYVTMALEYERKCTLLCMLDQTRKTPLLSQHHDEGTPICIAALENYPYLAYLQKKSGCATPILHHPLTATFGLVKAHCDQRTVPTATRIPAKGPGVGCL